LVDKNKKKDEVKKEYQSILKNRQDEEQMKLKVVEE